MKKTINEIREAVQGAAHGMSESAAYSGERGDGGASALLMNLQYFLLGYKVAVDAYVEDSNYILDAEVEVDVPLAWEKYFVEADPEYQEYIRLKEKFG